ncbi:MAG: RNA 3'-terminal phosphate cyclase [Fimbriiglobus sp.]
MIEIDGSEGEGGGQILRTSLTLSMLTGKPFKLINIRARRPKPGLAAQHLACVKAAAAISSAHYKGGTIGSAIVYFEPQAIKPGTYHFAVGTAGATALVLQTVALPLALGAKTESDVTIQGGTHVAHAPSYDFLETSWASHLEQFGIDLKLTMTRPGFYPRGGGEINARISPAPEVRPFRHMARQTVDSVHVRSIAASLPKKVAETQAHQITRRLKSLGITAHTELEEWPQGPSSVVSITYRQGKSPVHFYALGERGKKAEFVADDAFREFQAWVEGGATIDPHSADQILVPLALCERASEYMVTEITQHLLTNVETIRRFVDRPIDIEGELGEAGVVRLR